MDTTFSALDMHAVTRMLLVFAHMICLAAAGGFILLGDYAIFGQKNKINTQLLQKSAQYTLFVLLGLWFTGGSIIWLDTQFSPALLMSQGKLLAKLNVAIALSANGWLLHTIAFPSLSRTTEQHNALRAATWPAILGAVSLSSWIYAAFLGEARPLSTYLGYQGFIGLYVAFVMVAIAVSFIAIRPRLAEQMSSNEANAGIVSRNKTPAKKKKKNTYPATAHWADSHQHALDS